MSYWKIGLHSANGINPEAGAGWTAYKALAAPVVVAATDAAGVVYEAQQRNNPNPADVLMFRRTNIGGRSLDTCDYSANPETFARERIDELANLWPAELDRARVWTAAINEPSKEESEAAWLARFTLASGQRALERGLRLLALGWSTGTPEPWFWEQPEMLAYLRLCAANPGRLGVCLHEYSLADTIGSNAPYLVGRFLELHHACDVAGIARPPIVIGEFGWREDQIPLEPAAFAEQAAWAQSVYAPYDNVLGAALWTLGNWHGSVAADVVRLLPTLVGLARDYVATPPPPPEPPPGNELGLPREDYARTVWVLPPDATADDFAEISRLAHADRRTVGFSYDDAGIGALSRKTAVLWGIPAAQRQTFVDWYAAHYPGTAVEFREMPGTGGGAAFVATHWPTNYKTITQAFGNNPGYYSQFGLPGHEGVDIRAYSGTPVYAVAAGMVYLVENDPSSGNYGIQIRIQHDSGHQTVYAHLLETQVRVGDVVRGGQQIGLADNTGNSSGSHLHLTLKSPLAYAGGPAYIGYPGNIVDPTPYLQPLLDSAPVTPPGYVYNGPAVVFRPVLHGPASDWMWNKPALREMVAAVGLPLKYLSNGINADHFKADPWHMVRVFWQPDRKKSPAECWQDVGGDVVRLYQRGARRFELHNEPNLTSEGLGLVWESGAAFGLWLREFIGIMRSQCPEARLYYPGLSPGVPWTNQFQFTLEAWPLVRELCAGFCMHAYTGNTQDVGVATTDITNQVTELQRFLNLQVPLVVSEASVNRPAADAFRAAVYRAVEQRLAAVPGVEAVVWFVSDWDAGMDVNGERWLGTQLPAMYRGV